MLAGSIITLGRSRLAFALAAALSAGAALAGAASAQADGAPAAYSGSAEGVAAQISGTAEDESTTFTIGEALGTVNSAAGILADDSATDADESADVAAGAVTPLRIDGRDGEVEEGAARSSAPSNPSNETVALGISESGASMERALATSTSETEADSAATQNFGDASEVEVTTEDETTLATMSGTESLANIRGSGGGGVEAVGRTGVEDVVLVGGAVVVESVWGQSVSSVDSDDASGLTGFILQNLELRADPNGTPLLIFSAAPAEDSEVSRCDVLSEGGGAGRLIELSVAAGGDGPVSCTLPGGSDLLDPSNYQNESFPLRAEVEAAIEALTAPDAPLERHQIVLANGSSEEDEGSPEDSELSANALLEVLAVRSSATDEGGAPASAALENVEEAVLGRAYSEASFTPAVAAEEPPVEEPPVEEPPVEEPPVEEPSDTVDPTDVRGDDATTDDDPGAAVGDIADGSVPADSAGSEPTATDEETSDDRGSLPFTGFEPWMLAVIGLAALAGGVMLKRRLDGRRAVRSAA